ncbi:YaeQ family protein [Pseudohaliea rubra]|uniref:YaeQ protein n=1 Tax=Pseudohaliea rubra DSM 19751 TaxID=1265313 RepID=A0A095VNI4_9GAMM|nr:YaeQ family protein [Pseudohaliea rubra]KGE02648.1 YaeQ protein [Pseudohaliea rubra DSM 19751]
MALKSTVVRLKLQLADLDRQLYQDFPLTLARHPSETAARMMLRVLAFAFHADEQLAFGRGISTDEDPDLWLKKLDGIIDSWIELGTPEPDRLKRACGRAGRVVLYAYGDRAVPVWWNKHEAVLSRLGRLTVLQVADAALQALAGAFQPGMTLQCTISEGEALLSWEGGSVTVAPGLLKDPEK